MCVFADFVAVLWLASFLHFSLSLSVRRYWRSEVYFVVAVVDDNNYYT